MPRRKITEPASFDATDLPELTAQQQAFVRGVLEGKTASDAYRAAYDCSSMATSSVWVAASRLASDAKVSLWLSAARQACLGTHVVTLSGHQQQLERLREIALKTGNVGAAVQAEMARGKVAGHHVDRVMEVPHDPLDTLNELARTMPDKAAQLAAEHGIPWQPSDGATRH